MNKETTAVSMAQLGPFIKDTVADGNTVTLCVTGNSMAPLWHHLRNNVVLGSCDPSQLKRGDVPLYKRSNGQYVDDIATAEFGLEKIRAITAIPGTNDIIAVGYGKDGKWAVYRIDI